MPYFIEGKTLCNDTKKKKSKDSKLDTKRNRFNDLSLQKFIRKHDKLKQLKKKKNFKINPKDNANETPFLKTFSPVL